eukprot:899383-Prymnesium_polylepis.1
MIRVDGQPSANPCVTTAILTARSSRPPPSQCPGRFSRTTFQASNIQVHAPGMYPGTCQSQCCALQFRPGIKKTSC